MNSKVAGPIHHPIEVEIQVGGVGKGPGSVAVGVRVLARARVDGVDVGRLSLGEARDGPTKVRVLAHLGEAVVGLGGGAVVVGVAGAIARLGIRGTV